MESPRLLASVACLTLLSSACAAALVTVPTGPQPAKATATIVDYPPPPARVEEIPLGKHSGNRCVWRDGFWDWTGRRWEWQVGHAVIPPPGCYFAEGKLHWSTDSLSFYRPAWYPDPQETPPPKSCTEVDCIPAGAPPTAE